MTAPAVHRLLAAKGVRAFGDGFVSLLLPIYLLELGFSALQVGVIATATLLGSGLLTLVVGLHAYRFHYRTLLLAATVLMAGTGVVEGGAAHGPEAQAAPRDAHAPDQPLVAGVTLAHAYGHEVRDLPDAVRREEARHQHVGVGPVELLLGRVLGGGRDGEGAPLLVVQDRPEDAGGVEGGEAVPVDRAVHADEGRRPHVADDAVVLDRLVGHVRL